MERDEFLEAMKQRVRDAKTFEDIEAVFKDAFWVIGADFGEILTVIQNGTQQIYTKELAQYFEGLDIQTAIEQVGEYFTAAFPAWRKNPQGNLPLLVLDRKVGEEIGAKCQVVMLSAETLKKQDDHHPELTQKDYEKAQEAVMEGERLVQDSRNIAFSKDSKDGIVVIVKATHIGDELYMSSLYKLSSKDPKRKDEIRRLRKKQ